VPYELTFVQPVAIIDREQYINECCVGGDIIVDRLMPAVVAAGYTEIETQQEDWGWFIWFQSGAIHLAIDVFTDDGDAGEFRIRLSSRVKRRFFGHKEEDTPELQPLKALVAHEFETWTGKPVRVERGVT